MVLLPFSLTLLVDAGRAQEGRAAAGAAARAIHQRALTIDTHKDIEDRLAPESLPDDPQTREEFRRKFDPTVRGSCQVDFPKMREGGYDCAFFIVYVGQGPLTDAGYHRALAAAMAKFDAIHRMARLYPDQIGLATSPDEVEAIAKSGRLVACIGIENGYPMGTDLSLIQKFYERGARYMGITHNGNNQLGDSHSEAKPLHGGLSELGRKAVAEMNRLGIMVDISHSSRETMLQVLQCSKAPVLASHSGARAVCDHTRNLDDEQLRALRDNGGVIQCVALGSFVKDDKERSAAVQKLREELGLGGRRGAEPPSGKGKGEAGNGEGSGKGDDQPDLEQRMATFRERMQEVDARWPAATVRDFVDHIDHAVKVAGIDHVGISSDFDGGGGVVGWNDASETPNVTIELVRRGYTEEQIDKLWSGNLLRLWRDVAAVAARLKEPAK